MSIYLVELVPIGEVLGALSVAVLVSALVSQPVIRVPGPRKRESPRPERDSCIRRAMKMVDRGRVELPTPGFSVPCSTN